MVNRKTLDAPEPRRALFVHGAGGGGWEWEIWMRVFRSRGWCCEAPDLQAWQGDLGTTRLAHYRRQLEERVETIQPDALLGASMGGRLVLQLGPALPTVPLVLVNPHVPETGSPPDSESSAIRRWRDGPILDTLEQLPDAPFATSLWCSRRWRDESNAVLRDLWSAGESGLANPTLVVTGGADRSVSPEAQSRLAHRLGAESFELAGTSHLGALVGRAAAGAALRVLAWLEALRESSFSFNSGSGD